jgi:hypothetical protein
MPSPIPAVYKSMIRFVSDMIEEINADGSFPLVAYHNWENRGDENTLPPITLIGLDGFSFDENQGRWIIRVALAISSYRDTDLLEEIDMIGFVQDRLGEGQKIDLLEMVDGTTVSQMVVSAFKMLPMGQSEIRNYRTIGLELLRTSV